MNDGLRSLRSTLQSQQLSRLVDDSVDSGKLASLVKSPFSSTSSLSTSATFQSSGITDLRATVVAQQRRLDGFADKVALLLAAMREDILKDIHAAWAQDDNRVGSRLDELHSAGAELDARLASLRHGEGELRTLLQGEVREVAERCLGRVQEVHEHLAGEMRAMREHHLQGVQDRAAAEIESMQGSLTSTVQGLQKQVADEVQGLRRTIGGHVADLHERLADLEQTSLRAKDAEPAWQFAAERACAELREELRRDALDGSSPLAARLRAVEEQLRSGVAAGALAAATTAAGGSAAHQRRLECAELEMRRHTSVLEYLAEDVQLLKRGRLEAEDSGLQAVRWQRRAEEAVQSLEERVDEMERWRKRADEDAARPASSALLEPICRRLDGAESCLGALREEIGSLPSSMLALQRSEQQQHQQQHQHQQQQQQQHHHHHQAAAWQGPSAGSGGGDRRCLDEMCERADSLAISFSQESRHLADSLTVSFSHEARHLGQRVQKHTAALGVRVDKVEARLDAFRQQIVGLAEEQQRLALPPRARPGAQAHLDACAAQLQDTLERSMNRVQQDLEAQVLRAQRETAEGLGDELRRDLERKASQAHAGAERAAEQRQGDLRKEVEARLAQVQAFIHQLADELRAEVQAQAAQGQRATEGVRSDLELRITRLQGSTQRLADDVHHLEELGQDSEARAAQAQNASQRLMQEFRQEVEAELVQVRHTALQQQQRAAELCSTDHERCLEARLAQSHGMAQRLMAEWRQDMEARLAESSGAAAHATDELRQQLADDVAMLQGDLEDIRACADESRRQVRESIESFSASGEELRAHVAQETRRLVQGLGLVHPGSAIPLDSRSPVGAGSLVAAAGPAAREASSLLATPTASLHGPCSPLPGLCELGAGSPRSPGGGGGQHRRLFAALERRVLQQELAMSELRHANLAMQEELDAHRLEEKVSRSLAGLELPR